MNGSGTDDFMEGIHGSLNCVICHGGIDGEDDKETAHTNLVSDPAANADEACSRCHAGIVNKMANSLHGSFKGYQTLFETRSGITFADHPEIEHEFSAECGACHTTCGQCHISRPDAVKGGLVQGHQFMPVPSQADQCTACHGSRVGEEYTGSREGYAGDIHYIPNLMKCTDCHSGSEMHGTGVEYATRYESQEMPRCEHCHSDVAASNNYHTKHWGELQCQVCHSQDYKNCNLCHVGGTGVREPSYLAFKIGKNPIPDQRDYEYVVLRHIPIADDTYEPWGITSLDNFDALPTWKYASPHNIRRWTARTDTVDADGNAVGCGTLCHTTPDDDIAGWFLRQVDLDNMTDPKEVSANQAYICPDGSPTGW